MQWLKWLNTWADARKQEHKMKHEQQTMMADLIPTTDPGGGASTTASGTEIIRVLVAAAIDNEGTWCVYGCKGVTPEEMMNLAVDNCQEGERRFWVEVELKTPVSGDPETIRATSVTPSTGRE